MTMYSFSVGTKLHKGLSLYKSMNSGGNTLIQRELDYLGMKLDYIH